MAVGNSLKQNKMQNTIVEYKCGEETVKLSPNIIRNYLVSGNGNVTDQEVGMFLNLCRFQHLNPFLREAYLIKFGNNPATIVTSKEALMKRAMRNPAYAGQQAGIIIYHDESREFEHRNGSLLMPGERLVGGWAKVYVKGYQVPIEATVSFNEYIGTKNDGTPNQQWQKRPGTMIRKVALVQALREAFPDDLGGLYASEEIGVDFDETTASAPVEVPAQEPNAETPQLAEPDAPDNYTMEDLPGGF